MAYTFVQEINTQCNCFLYPLTINKVTYAVSRGLKECNLLIKNVKLLEVQIITMVIIIKCHFYQSFTFSHI